MHTICSLLTLGRSLHFSASENKCVKWSISGLNEIQLSSNGNSAIDLTHKHRITVIISISENRTVGGLMHRYGKQRKWATRVFDCVPSLVFTHWCSQRNAMPSQSIELSILFYHTKAYWNERFQLTLWESWHMLHHCTTRRENMTAVCTSSCCYINGA